MSVQLLQRWIGRINVGSSTSASLFHCHSLLSCVGDRGGKRSWWFISPHLFHFKIVIIGYDWYIRTVFAFFFNQVSASNLTMHRCNIALLLFVIFHGLRWRFQEFLAVKLLYYPIWCIFRHLSTMTRIQFLRDIQNEIIPGIKKQETRQSKIMELDFRQP